MGSLQQATIHLTMILHSLLVLFFLLPLPDFIFAKSSKKGFSFGKSGQMCEDLKAFSSVNWYYDWGTAPHSDCDTPPPPGFVPMVWGYYGHTPDIEGEFLTILGYNEPNHQDQSNLSPEKAATGWMELQEKFPDKVLVSPSASALTTTEWFDEFFTLCDILGCRVDYLATHCYKGNAEHVMQFVEELYHRYGRKIWLTEFAKSNTRDPAKVLAFMKQMLPLLEKSEAVFRYSWFVTRFPADQETQRLGNSSSDWFLDKANSLLEVDSPTPVLTELGRFYDSV